MLAFDLIIDVVKKVGDGFVVANLYELYAKFVLICAKAVKLFRSINNDFFNILERTFRSPICKDD